MILKRCKKPKNFDELAGRIEALEERLSGKLYTHESLERYYIDLIHDCAQSEAEHAVAQMLQHPIEMTIEDIEKAFSHKVKVVAK